MVANIAPVAVIGPGRIGRGIALAFALAGRDVALVDLKQRDAQERTRLTRTTRAALEAELIVLVRTRLLSKRSVRAIVNRCRVLSFPTPDGSSALPYDFYFEGVPEQLAIKRNCYAWLNEVARPDAIIASSTSTLPVDTLAALVKQPERYLNAHWLNPAHLMPLVELSASSATAADATSRLRDLLESIGKVPVSCSASAGYIVPRLQALAMNEAARMVEEGVASAEEIDRAVRTGFGIRYAVLGLLEFIDWGGGDILFHASEHLAQSHGAERFAAPAVIAQNMAAQRRGLRDGVGFYDFRQTDVASYRLERMVSFVELLRHLRLLPAPLLAGRRVKRPEGSIRPRP